jgi:FAD/FMN-containing dehydrogenase
VLCEAARVRDESAGDPGNRPTEPIRLAPTNPYLRITLGTEIKTFPIRPGLAYVGRSTVNDIDVAIRPKGWELRIHPSTTETATIAGFVAGGSGGIGSAQWGMLRDRGNIASVEVMSVEEEPKLIELTGNDIELVHHAYGTNGIITEIEMPVAPAWTWHECLVAFDDFRSCARFGLRLCLELAITKKVISLQEWPLPHYMRNLHDVIPEQCSMANCYIAEASMAAFADLVAEHGGAIVADNVSGENPFGAPLFEFAYGHGMRQIQKTNPKFTGFQGMFPADGTIEAIMAVREAAGNGPALRPGTRP